MQNLNQMARNKALRSNSHDYGWSSKPTQWTSFWWRTRQQFLNLFGQIVFLNLARPNN